MNTGRSSAWAEVLESRTLLSATPPGTYLFGNVAGKHGVKAVVVDADGSVNTFNLAGGGTGTITVSDTATDLAIDGTSAGSSITVTSRGGDGRASLRSIHASGAVGNFQAKILDVSNGDILLPFGIRTLTLGNVQDETLSAPGAAIGSLSLIQWNNTDSTADVITLAALGRLKVGGDFGANLIVASLGNASVGGTWSGDATIDGNAGALKIGHLRGSMNISGTARSIQLADYLAVSQVASATGGMLHVGGSTRIKSAGESFNASAATLFTSSAAMYTPQELIRYDELGSVRTYSKTTRHAGKFSGGTSTDTVESNMMDVDGRSSWIVDTTDPDASTSSVLFRDSAGTYETRAMVAGSVDGSSLVADLGLLRLAPSVLELKQTTTATASITATLTDPVLDHPAILSGTASSATTLLGHERVTTDAGTYLAAKLLTILRIQVSGSITFSGRSFPVRLNVVAAQTYWAVPVIGIVRQIETAATNISIAGHGSTMDRASEISELVSYTPGM